jgi:hypothetical protein
MDKRTRLFLVIAVLAVGGYLAVRWYEQKQAAANGNTQGGAADGSNLNSIAPELVGGSTGPSIGPALSTPITINVTSSSPPAAANPVGQTMIGGTASPSPLALANPSNSMTGAQSAAPVNSDVSGGSGAATSAGTGTTATTPASSTAATPTTKTAGAPAASPAARPVTAHRSTPAKPVKRAGHPKAKPKPKVRS